MEWRTKENHNWRKEVVRAERLLVLHFRLTIILVVFVNRKRLMSNIFDKQMPMSRDQSPTSSGYRHTI